MEKMEKLTPEQLKKTEERTSYDAQLIKKGAKYVQGQNDPQPRLEVENPDAEIEDEKMRIVKERNEPDKKEKDKEYNTLLKKISDFDDYIRNLLTDINKRIYEAGLWRSDPIEKLETEISFINEFSKRGESVSDLTLQAKDGRYLSRDCLLAKIKIFSLFLKEKNIDNDFLDEFIGKMRSLKVEDADSFGFGRNKTVFVPNGTQKAMSCLSDLDKHLRACSKSPI